MANDNPALDELRKLAAAPADDPPPAEEPVETPEPEDDPEPAPPTEPEQQTAEPPPGEPPKEPNAMPAGLRGERDRRKAAEEDAAEQRAENEVLRNQMRALHEKLSGIEQSLQPKDEKPSAPVVDDPEPDASEDFAAWTQWQHRETARRFEAQAKETAAIQEQLAERQKLDQQREQARQLQAHYAQSAQAMVKEEPAFGDAYKHVLVSRAQELRRQHPFASQQEITAQINSEEFELVSNAVRNGQDPARVIVQTARGYGWQPPAPAPETPAQLAPQPVEPAQAAPDPAPKKTPLTPPISLGNVGGRPSKGPMKPKDMAKLGITDFSQVYDTKGGRDMLREALTNRA